MISLEHPQKNRKITIPTSWDELTPSQYIGIVKILQGSPSLGDIGLKVLYQVSGYKRNTSKKYTYWEAENIDFNLFRLSQHMYFCVKPYYQNPDILDVLSDDLKERLQYTFPEQLSEPEDLKQINMISDKLKYHPVVDISGMYSNPLPTLNMLAGPEFTITSIIETDILTGEFIDMADILRLYKDTQDENHLKTLAGVLYRPDRKHYNSNDALKRGKSLPFAPDSPEIVGVYWFAERILQYLSEHPVYFILFGDDRNGGKEDKLSTGTSAIIDSLSKDGFGSRNEILQTPITETLNMLVNSIKSGVKELREAEYSVTQIAQKTGLSREKINEII